MKQSILICLGLIFFSCHHSDIQQSAIIPMPNNIEYRAGTSEVGLPLLIQTFDTLFNDPVFVFNDFLKHLSGIHTTESASGTLILIHDTTLQQNSYQLQIENNSITLTAGDKSGMQFALISLLQLIETVHSKDDKKFVLQNIRISDSPAFQYRGMHLDVSRHFFGAENVKKYIQLMALYKLNTLHWHITDDQGWRIEIKSHPKLTKIGAWRKGTGMEPWTYFTEMPEEGSPRYGGYYTHKEVKEIVEFAAMHQIRIIPEIEMPGHSSALIAAYPEVSCKGKLFKKSEDTPFEFHDPMCAGNERTFKLLEDIIDEVVELFPAPYIHIGGDEAKKSAWEKCPKCQKRMKENNLGDIHELQSYFIKRMEKYIQSKGRRIIGWDEILEGGLAPNATVMSWRNEEGGIAAATSGHDAIMTPSQFLYFDHYQDIPENEPRAIGGYSPLEKVYNYHPVPETLDEKYHKHILGAQANVWTEYMKTWDYVEYMVVPRIMALAELNWTKKKNKDFSNFKTRLHRHYPLLDNLNIHYHIPQVEGLSPMNLFIEKGQMVLSNPIGYGDIHFTLDGTNPTRESNKYIEPVDISESTKVKAAIIFPNGNTGSIKTGVFKKTDYEQGIDSGHFEAGIEYKYFETNEIESISELENLTPVKTGLMNELRIPDFVREDHWAIEWEGFLEIKQEDIFTFYTNSDDGSILYINNQKIVDNDGVHGIEFKTGLIALDSGYHEIKIQYFEAAYGQSLEIGLISKEEKKIPLHTMNLLHKIDN